MLKPHFEQFAAYNRWANQRLYDDAERQPEEARKRELGLFFHSLHGTLNHILVADRVWLRRLTGEGPQPERLNQILFDDFAALRAAREHEDARIIRFVGGLSEADLDATFSYHTMSGKAQEQRRAETLAHFFNHQTHHRGQAHAALTILGMAEPAPLDLLAMQRG
ncbi:MAG TPA: DinB family protein [Acetobacteraceae bacterium]|nr:DinB family protein [Acetobacteraceae bacterium]